MAFTNKLNSFQQLSSVLFVGMEEKNNQCISHQTFVTPVLCNDCGTTSCNIFSQNKSVVTKIV